MPRKRTPVAVNLPTLPPTALVWDGPAVARAMAERHIDPHVLGIVLARHPETVRRWTLPTADANACKPPVDVASDLAAVLFGDPRRVADFLVLVDRVTGVPIPVQAPLFPPVR